MDQCKWKYYNDRYDKFECNYGHWSNLLTCAQSIASDLISKHNENAILVNRKLCGNSREWPGNSGINPGALKQSYKDFSMVKELLTIWLIDKNNNNYYSIEENIITSHYQFVVNKSSYALVFSSYHQDHSPVKTTTIIVVTVGPRLSSTVFGHYLYMVKVVQVLLPVPHGNLIVFSTPLRQLFKKQSKNSTTTADCPYCNNNNHWHILLPILIKLN